MRKNEKRLLTIIILLAIVAIIFGLAGCTLFGFGGSDNGKAIPSEPVKTLKQRQLEKKMADASAKMAIVVDESGAEANTPLTNTLRKSTGVLSTVLGQPLHIYDWGVYPPPTFDVEVLLLMQLQGKYEVAMDKWKLELKELREENALLKTGRDKDRGLISTLTSSVAGIVALILVIGTLASAAYSWFVRKELIRTIVSVAIGGTATVLWFLFWEEVIFIGLVVAAVAIIVYIWKSYKGSKVEKYASDVVEDVQEWRLANKDSAARKSLDKQFGKEEDAGRAKFVAKVKDKRGLKRIDTK
jgi:hypothetical protein